jgi:hypothetical protein
MITLSFCFSYLIKATVDDYLSLNQDAIHGFVEVDNQLLVRLISNHFYDYNIVIKVRLVNLFDWRGF